MRALFPTLMTAAALPCWPRVPGSRLRPHARCAAKFCQIENDIAQAQAHGNNRQGSRPAPRAGRSQGALHR